MSSPRAFLWIAVALLLLAFGLRAYRLPEQSLWFDEGWSTHVALLPPAQALPEIASAGHTHPPGYYLLLGAWTTLAGASEYALRYLTVLTGLLLAALGAALARRRFGRRAGLLALAALALLPVLVVYSQETRMYMQLALLYVALIWAFDVAASSWTSTDRGWRPWLVLGALEAAALYTHYFAAILIMWLGLVALLRAAAAAPDPASRRRTIARLLGTQVVVAVLYLPWAAVAFRQLGDHVPRAVTPPTLFDFVSETWAFFNAGVLGMAARIPAFGVAAGLAGALFAAAAAWALGRSSRRRDLALLLAHGLVPIAIVFAIGQVRPGVHPRYLIMASAPLMLALAASLSALRGPGRGRPARLALAIATGAAFLCAWAIALNAGFHDSTYHRDDVRAVAEQVMAESAPGDAVLVDVEDYAFRYYYDGPASLGVLNAIEAEETVAAELAAQASPGGAVYALDWAQGRTDYRGLLPALLEAGGRYEGWDKHRAFRLHRYRLAPDADLALPALRPEEADFGALRLAGAWTDGSVPAAEALPFALRWSLPAATDRRLKSVVELFDPAGNRVAQADTLIHDARGLTTDLWAPGAEATMYAVLPVPPGTVPGRYRLELGVYAEDERGSLAARDPSGAPAATRHDLGVVEVTPGVPSDADPYGSLAALGLVEAPPGKLAPGIVLEALRFDPPRAAPGGRVSVALLWRAEDEPARPFAPTLRLRRDGAVLAEDADAPALDAYPTERWRAGERVLDRRRLELPADAEGGPAQLELVLAEQALALGTVEVTALARAFEPPDSAHALDARVPGVGGLVGANLAAEGRCELRGAGEATPRLAVEDPADCRLLLELVWVAEGAAPTDLTVFTHLLAEDRTMLAQHDGPPAGGERPTSGWLAGEYVTDRHALAFQDGGALDAAAPGGEATLEVGLYDPTTLERVPAADGADHVVLPLRIRIER